MEITVPQEKIDFPARKLARYVANGGDPDAWLDSKDMDPLVKIEIIQRARNIDTQPPAALKRLAQRR